MCPLAKLCQTIFLSCFLFVVFFPVALVNAYGKRKFPILEVFLSLQGARRLPPSYFPLCPPLGQCSVCSASLFVLLFLLLSENQDLWFSKAQLWWLFFMVVMLIYGRATDNYLGILFKWSNKYLSYRQNVIDALS